MRFACVVCVCVCVWRGGGGVLCSLVALITACLRAFLLCLLTLVSNILELL